MNDKPIYDYAMQCLQTLRYTRREVSEGSGVPFSTVCKVAQGTVKEPSVHTVQAIADFFRREERALNKCRHDEAAHEDRRPTDHEQQEAA